METVAIKAMDAAWLYVEKQDAPAHFGPLLVMTPPPGSNKDFVYDMVASWRQCRDFKPPFNYKVAPGIIPKWEVVEPAKMDMEYHLMHSALPHPGGEQELGILISRLHSHKLDRDHPLWQCYVIEGLEGGRFAIYIKLHHSQLDGMGAAKLMQRSFSTDAEQRDMPPPWATSMRVRGLKPPKIKAKTTESKSLIRDFTAMKSLVTSLGTMADKAYLGKDKALSAPFQGPDSIINKRVSPHRRYATQSYPLARIKAVANAAQVKVNDVFLGITGAALRRYLLELNALPTKPLIGQIPVNVRTADGNEMGNALAFIYSTLGTDISDPLARIKAVSQSTDAAKAIHTGLSASAIEPFTMLMLAPYMTEVILGLGGYTRAAANLVISNVTGPRERLYLNGARVEQIYGPSVLFHGQALNITMSSYVDEINIGYTACRESLPSIQRLAVYSGEALSELEEVLGIVSPQA